MTDPKKNNTVINIISCCLFFVINALDKKVALCPIWVNSYDAKVLSQIDNIILRCSPTVEQDDRVCRLYYFGKSHPDNYRSSSFYCIPMYDVHCLNNEISQSFQLFFQDCRLIQTQAFTL